MYVIKTCDHQLVQCYRYMNSLIFVIFLAWRWLERVEVRSKLLCWKAFLLTAGYCIYPTYLVFDFPMWHCSPLYVGLRSGWGSVDGDIMFFPICRRAPFWGLLQTNVNEWMKEKLDQCFWWRSTPIRGDSIREHGGGSLTGDSEGKTY